MINDTNQNPPKGARPTTPVNPPSGETPSPWNPALEVFGDTATGRFRLTINFGMGYPWITCRTANPFRIADSGPVFESECDAMAAGDFFIEALNVLMHDFSKTGH